VIGGTAKDAKEAGVAKEQRHVVKQGDEWVAKKPGAERITTPSARQTSVRLRSCATRAAASE
jgi:hypothetical protein